VKQERVGTIHLSPDWLEGGLSPLAQRSSASRGRVLAEEPCTLRTSFQRDRDRIVHSKSFRRLKHKTQVFISPEGDHYRTRLTHTLEVSGIARTVARALRLNEDLTEAIALGHDLGHTPFGHAGEEALDRVLGELGAGGFRHNEQSARVVELLENDGRGLNLTWEVIDGIRWHTGERQPATLEGQIVRVSDRIAYINHDIDDALRASLISNGDLPPGPLEALGATGSDRIDCLVHDLVDASAVAGAIVQTPEIGKAMADLRTFLFQTVYARSLREGGQERVSNVIRHLVMHFLAHPEHLPGALSAEEAAAEEQPAGQGSSSAGTGNGDGARGDGAGSGASRAGGARAVADYVAGMTDRYAQRAYLELFVPKSWVI
jgi:dGTPase